jgi:hypothetical protein
MSCLGKDQSRVKTALKNLPNINWEPVEDKFLRDNYGLIPIKDICKILNRNQGAVIQYAKRHGIQSNRYWTEEQEEFLKNNYMEDYDVLCSKLGKTIPALQHKISRLGLRRNMKWCKSRLETEFEGILKEMNLGFDYQYQVGRGVYDYKIDNLLIEVQGNYWHCNPKFFPDGPIDDRQKVKIARDQQKLQIAIDNRYHIAYAWEDDIYNNRELVKNSIGVAVLKSRNEAGTLS